MEKRECVLVMLVFTFFLFSPFAAGAQPVLRIDKPEGMYATGRIWLDIEFDMGPGTIEYAIDDKQLQRLCTNCNIFRGYKGFSEGKHVFEAVATDKAGIKYYATSAFTVDTTRPRILAIEPQGTYTTGIFKVRYTEPSLKQITLFFGGSKDTVTSCPSGPNMECTFTEKLNEGALLIYYFELVDSAGNLARSNTVKVKVDATPPIISVMKPADGNLFRRYVDFDIGANERLKKLSYITGTTEKVLCASCQFFKGKQGFRAGFQAITIKAEDFAGNKASILRQVEVI